jgi:hypothetical protein
MHGLANALLDCQHADRGTDEEIRQHTIDAAVRMEMNPDLPIAPFAAARVEGAIDSVIALRDQCSRVDRLEPTHALDWFDRAASAGYTPSMRFYADAALGDADDPALADADELERRKARALAYMNQALELRDCLVLERFEWQYAGEASFSLVAPDPAAAFAYAWARYRWESQLNPNVPPSEVEFWNEHLGSVAASVDPTVLDAALARGESIYRAHCLNQPMILPPM